jgi:hypothetical protein
MHKLKALMIASILTLPLGAFLTSPAPAATAGWRVGGTSLTGTAALASTASLEEPFLLDAGFEIECSGTTAQLVLPELRSSSNQVVIRAGELTKCKIPSEVACAIEGQKINIGSLLGEATLQGALTIKTTFKPEKGSAIFSWRIVGERCGVVGKDEIGGKLTTLAPTGQDERAAQLFQWSVTAASGELSPSVAAKGAVLLKLSSGQPWSFL